MRTAAPNPQPEANLAPRARHRRRQRQQPSGAQPRPAASHLTKILHQESVTAAASSLLPRPQVATAAAMDQHPIAFRYPRGNGVGIDLEAAGIVGMKGTPLEVCDRKGERSALRCWLESQHL